MIQEIGKLKFKREVILDGAGSQDITIVKAGDLRTKRIYTN